MNEKKKRFSWKYFRIHPSDNAGLSIFLAGMAEDDLAEHPWHMSQLFGSKSFHLANVYQPNLALLFSNSISVHLIN